MFESCFVVCRLTRYNSAVLIEKYYFVQCTDLLVCLSLPSLSLIMALFAAIFFSKGGLFFAE